MHPQLALLILGLLTIGAVALAFLGMLLLRFRLRATDTRQRALPAGRPPLSPALWDGKAALDRAEAAAREVRA